MKVIQKKILLIVIQPFFSMKVIKNSGESHKNTEIHTRLSLKVILFFLFYESHTTTPESHTQGL